MQNVAEGMEVYEATITRHLLEELPFMASENIMMAAVAAGGDRQTLHQVIRNHSVQAGNRVKREGATNDLIERLRQDPHFANVALDSFMDPSKYVGRAPEQVDEFVAEVVAPIRARYTTSYRKLIESLTAMASLPIAVLISGGGTTLRNLLEHRDAGKLNVDFRMVISSKASAFGLTYAQNANIPSHIVSKRQYASPEEHSAAVCFT